MMAVRVAESAAIAVLLASIVAIIFLTLSLWRGWPIGRGVEMLMAAGLICGIAWGIIRRPGIFAAALESDRQLQLSELLSSAWLAERHELLAHHPWAGLVLREADARCSNISRSSVTFRRFGGRMWGAMALAAGLVITLRLLAPAPQIQSIDRDGRDTHALALASADAKGQTHADIFLAPDNRPVILDDPQDLNHSSFGENPSTPPTKPGPDQSPNHSPSDAHHDATSAEAGAGGGTARTESHAPSANLAVSHAQTPSTPSADNNAQRAIGTGAASNEANQGTTPAAGMTSSAQTHATLPPPWTGNDWPTDIRRAQTALDDGHVPAGYRDLVRGYFAE